MKKFNDALLTIIIPAYNAEKYITECLDSLINQTVQNHKIIIVNDGSTDKTEAICLKYQKQYPELIKYIYQENQGQGEARNVGMKLVDTPYTGFLDSDDFLMLKYVEKFTEMVEMIDEMPDIIFTLPWVYDSISGRIYQWMDKGLYDHIFAVHEGVSNVQTNIRLNPELLGLEVNACRKIYRSEFLKKNEFTFPKGMKWEDVPGHFLLLHWASTCAALPEVGFVYRINHESQTTAGKGKTRLDMLPIFKQLLKLCDQCHFTEIEKSYVLRLILNFSKWSIDVTNSEYIEALLNGLHIIYKSLSKEEIDFYLNTVSPDRRRELGLIELLRGNDYLKLKDYFERDSLIDEKAAEILKDKQKNIVRGGIQCVCDHGISYTAIYMVRKYLLGKGR